NEQGHTITKTVPTGEIGAETIEVIQYVTTYPTTLPQGEVITTSAGIQVYTNEQQQVYTKTIPIESAYYTSEVTVQYTTVCPTTLSNGQETTVPAVVVVYTESKGHLTTKTVVPESASYVSYTEIISSKLTTLVYTSCVGEICHPETTGIETIITEQVTKPYETPVVLIVTIAVETKTATTTSIGKPGTTTQTTVAGESTPGTVGKPPTTLATPTIEGQQPSPTPALVSPTIFEAAAPARLGVHLEITIGLICAFIMI
ncbi:MAG: hypothetical protein M5F18_08670, partial [Asgard group archaeon]|nr:hypothetical protein [Asgard group archaeon]